ncbi:cell division protein ZapA [Sphingomonas sp. H39-1-10]|uniref:cell division protein ZapA n=1 Tax=Sphingomonas TaxID=13687 RepID=UPI00087EFFCA|nr:MULTISPECIES: cell division protein ZapA [Sphingomonas]MDF0487420.1 cell division protein ZapA [Sphingomonas pollutisoli]SDA16071.1 cell division protein ZapA [Sphingomonas sp. NFR15]
MADVTLTIGDRRHVVACRDGEEERLMKLGALLDSRWADAARASGGMSAERTMLFIALLLADSLDESERRPAELAESHALDRVAEWLEDLADALENRSINA